MISLHRLTFWVPGVGLDPVRDPLCRPGQMATSDYGITTVSRFFLAQTEAGAASRRGAEPHGLDCEAGFSSHCRMRTTQELLPSAPLPPCTSTSRGPVQHHDV